MRTVLFTGKGGVGKTSVAAATAIAAARAGKRTLVVSTDAAHSLSDSIDAPLGNTPTAVRAVPGLHGLQVDACERLEDAWADVAGYLIELFGWAGVDAVEAEELATLPGLEEVFALTAIEEQAASGAWDALIVDCAPTAETVRLLSLPDILGWYVDRVFPATRTMARIARPLMSRIAQLPPVANDQVFTALERLLGRLDRVRLLLADEQHTTLRLVVNPERMVVAEARRTATYLALFGYRVDAVVANRLLPQAVSDPWFDAWRATHAEQLAAIEDGFAPVPVLRADLAQEELVGVERLTAFAETLYGELDPMAVLHTGPGLEISRTPTGSMLRLPLPFCDHDELEVGRRDGELLVRVGPYRRAVGLPDSLRRRPVVGAGLEDGWLRVDFGAVGAAAMQT